MRIRLVVFIGLATLVTALPTMPVRAADCGQGSTEDKIACLQSALGELEEKVATLTKDLKTKAKDVDSIKWYDRVTLMNEDMRIYPRCIDNPGPNSQNITDLFATSCAKVPSQTWLLRKPYK